MGIHNDIHLDQEPDSAIWRVIDGKGARPSSLVPASSPSKPDPLHDLQLLRDLKTINEQTVRELGPLPPGGGLAVREKRKPLRTDQGTAGDASTPIENEEQQTSEDEAMKASHMIAIAALAAGSITCHPAMSTMETTMAANAGRASKEQKLPTTSTHPVSGSTPTDQTHTDTSRERLGLEYKKIDSFVEFRKRLLADGWKPVINPKCREAVVGVGAKDFCSEHPGQLGCRVCDMVPEIIEKTFTFPGYLTTRYMKGGTPLTVLSHGDIQDLEQPGKYELFVDAWDYTDKD